MHPPYSSPDLVAAPVKSVVESGQGGLSGARPMRQEQLSFAICARLSDFETIDCPGLMRPFPDKKEGRK